MYTYVYTYTYIYIHTHTYVFAYVCVCFDWEWFQGIVDVLAPGLPQPSYCHAQPLPPTNKHITCLQPL